MRSSISARRRQGLSYQSLEGRRLLAGNVTVELSGSTLVVSGDDLANQIDVSQNDNGEVLFTGLDSTTINGQTEFTFAQDFERSRFDLNGGADEVNFFEFESGREFRFLGGAGDDRLEAIEVSADYFHVRGNAGDDALQFVQSVSRRSAYFHLGTGDDVLAVESFDAGRNFKVYGNNGDDTFASNTLSVNRKFRLNLGNGNDEALIAGETDIGKSAKVRLGSGDDFLGVLPGLNEVTATFDKNTFVDTGNGDDVVVLGAASTFARTAVIKGRSGSDSIDTGEANFERASVIRQFENQSVDNQQEILDGIFERLEANGFDSSQFGNQIDSLTSLTLTIPEAEVEFVENGGPVEIASDLVLEANALEIVESATVVIENGSSLDSLSFEPSGNVTGSFDSATSTLTLSGGDFASEYQTVLRSIEFESSGDTPLEGIRNIVFTVQSEFESPFSSVTGSRDVQVTAVDDALDLVLPDLLGDDALVQQQVGQAFGFTFADADPDDSVTYQLDLEDSGISGDVNQPVIDPDTGEFSWTPSETGDFVVRVIATNDQGESDQEEFTVSVVDEVELEIAAIEDQTVDFNDSLELQVEVAGFNSASPVSFTLEASGDAVDGTNNLPTISDDGLITWTPDLLTSGTAEFLVTATDGSQVSTAEIFEVTLPGFQPFLGNGQLAAVAPIDRNGIYDDIFDGAGPEFTIDTAQDYTATISTEAGDIVVDLFEDLTPISVNSFVNLAQDGFYDGLSFHRVIETPVSDEFGLPVLDDDGSVQFERFVAQGGDPTNSSSGGPGYRINDEILSELTFDRPGVLAYAKTSAPNSNGGQFFITYDATEFQNDENFTIFGEVIDFGEVVDGENALDRINLTDPSDFDPATPTIIDTITIDVS